MRENKDENPATEKRNHEMLNMRLQNTKCHVSACVYRQCATAIDRSFCVVK